MFLLKFILIFPVFIVLSYFVYSVLLFNDKEMAAQYSIINAFGYWCIVILLWEPSGTIFYFTAVVVYFILIVMANIVYFAILKMNVNNALVRSFIETVLYWIAIFFGRYYFGTVVY